MCRPYYLTVSLSSHFPQAKWNDFGNLWNTQCWPLFYDIVGYKKEKEGKLYTLQGFSTNMATEGEFR